MGVLKDLKNLLFGMGITGKHLGRHAITIQYPEEKWEMPERSRGIVVLLSDKKTGELNCTGCMLCMRACPTAAIRMDAPRGEDKKRRLTHFDIDFALCCFCGLCEEACLFCALKMAPKYEFSSVSKEELVWDMHKLQEVGRDVDYVDTRKKKKPKPEATPTAEAEPAPTAEAEPAPAAEAEPTPAAEPEPVPPAEPAPPDPAEPKPDATGQEESCD